MMGLARFVQTHSAPWRKLSRLDLVRRAFDEGCKISDRQWSKRCADVQAALAEANESISRQAEELAKFRAREYANAGAVKRLAALRHDIVRLVWAQ